MFIIKYSPIILFVIMGLFISSSFAQQTQIIGHLTKLDTSERIYLSENIGGKYHIIDSSDVLKNNLFYFHGQLETGYYAIWKDQQNWAQFIVNNIDSIIEIEFDSEILRDSITVLQSDENKLLWKFISVRKQFQSALSNAIIMKSYFPESRMEYQYFTKQEDSIKISYNNYLLGLYKSNPSSFLSKTILSDYYTSANEDFFKYTLFSQEELIRSGVLTKKMTEYLQLHTEFNEEGFINSINHILNLAKKNEKVYEFSLNYLIELFNKVGPDVILQYLVETYILDDACTELEYSTLINNELQAYKNLQIGKTAPNVSLFNQEGIMQNLLDICSTSNINVLFFGSSSCSFCQSSYPILIDFSKSFTKENMKIIYYSMDDIKEDYENLLNKLPASWLSFTELKAWDSRMVELYKINKTPSFYILDSRLKILGKPKSIDELIDELNFLLSN